MSIKIKDLKEPYREMALINQERQGNTRDDSQYLNRDREIGNFSWDDTNESFYFWSKVNGGSSEKITPEIEINYPSIFIDAPVAKGFLVGDTLKCVSEDSWGLQVGHIYTCTSSGTAAITVKGDTYTSSLTYVHDVKRFELFSKDEVLNNPHDLEVGGIYKYKEYVLEVTGTPTSSWIPSTRYLNVCSDYYHSDGSRWSGYEAKNFTKPSFDEVKWFIACKNAGKFVSKDDALGLTQAAGTKFKVGDIVIRTDIDHMDVKQGEVLTISKIEPDAFGATLQFKGKGIYGYSIDSFELHSVPAPESKSEPKFKIGDIVEVVHSSALGTIKKGESYVVKDVSVIGKSIKLSSKENTGFWDTYFFKKATPSRLVWSDVHVKTPKDPWDMHRAYHSGYDLIDTTLSDSFKPTSANTPNKGYVPHVAKKKKKRKVELKFKSL
jgi:hypothetical protein